MKNFTKVHDEILKTFFVDLKSEAENDKQLKTVRLLRHCTHRQQVTEWIYNLAGPYFDTETTAKHENFLNQRESRDELLHQYLQSRARLESPDDWAHATDAPELDSSDEDEEDASSLEELESLVNFLVSGLSFENLRINLYGLAHPDQAIEEALRTEIAQLLAEESSNKPWIYFEPRYDKKKHLPLADSDFHVPGCVHSLASSVLDDKRPTKLSKDQKFQDTVQELCGIAGVAPDTCDKNSWNSAVHFAPDSSMATVTYSLSNAPEIDDEQILLTRIIQTLERVLAAVACLQCSGLCCNSYTVITAGRDTGVVHLKEIRVHKLGALLHRVQCYVILSLPNFSYQHDYLEDAWWKCCQILDVFEIAETNMRGEGTKGAKLHLMALTTKFASLVFLSYSQAHLAPIQPFFLDTALERVSLTESGDLRVPFVIAKSIRLTCLDDMLRSAVTVFQMVRASSYDLQLGSDPLEARYDLSASATDLIGKGTLV
ncbi:hypothetical protein EK21DRAFT_91028 [Setomelanomma holmii]|uniref:Uncharacterized protein n=1 Tax=Setomelanomma holmii TaxID=210430 RepID=A0A9P4LLF0_9PLEO|nr:hypothetical protein EK21DRAFT_91028 [Setomelanomma holmii]